MNSVTFVPINLASQEFRAGGKDFATWADAYVAALTDGEGRLERDARGRMTLVDSDRVFSFCSTIPDDVAAKEEVVRELSGQITAFEGRFGTLKVERDEEGRLVQIDDSDNAALLEYWDRRIGSRPAGR